MLDSHYQSLKLEEGEGVDLIIYHRVQGRYACLSNIFLCIFCVIMMPLMTTRVNKSNVGLSQFQNLTCFVMVIFVVNIIVSMLKFVTCVTFAKHK